MFNAKLQATTSYTRPKNFMHMKVKLFSVMFLKNVKQWWKSMPLFFLEFFFLPMHTCINLLFDERNATGAKLWSFMLYVGSNFLWVFLIQIGPFYSFFASWIFDQPHSVSSLCVVRDWEIQPRVSWKTKNWNLNF